MEKHPKILIVCGEASGDHHAASLVRAIREREPSVEFFGAGGPRLKGEGVDIVFDLTSVAVIGFFEVLRHLATFKRVFRQILAQAQLRKPDLAILLDYPGFNLALAKELRKQGIPVIYYISPQIWAWGKGRITAIKRDIAKMMVILPFEKALYEAAGVEAEFVGHPALDAVKPSMTGQRFREVAGLDKEKLTVALLPGSREKEVRSLLPVMLEAARIIHSYMPPSSVQFVILASPSMPPEIFRKLTAAYPDLPVKVTAGMAYDGIAASDFCMVCSGTATLETGILGTPMVILYKVHFLTWLYVRLLIRIPFIGLVNIVKGRKVMEEFLQFACTPANVAGAVLPALHDREHLDRLRRELAGIRESLGEPGASGRAAACVLEYLRKIRPAR